MQGPVETEVKIALPASHSFSARLFSLGFREYKARVFESNTLFDTPEQQLRSRQMLLRLRQAGPKSVITWKGKGKDGPHKSRPELETEIGSLETFSKILSEVGFAPTFRYEKYRTEFVKNDGGVVTLDETPIGDFLELEGDADWIDRTAVELGFGPADYMLESYGRLFLDYRAKHDLEARDMTFPARQ